MKTTLRLAALAAILCGGFYALAGHPSGAPAANYDTPSIERMHHVGINVTDLQRSADWYEKVLGTIFHKWKTTWQPRLPQPYDSPNASTRRRRYA